MGPFIVQYMIGDASQNLKTIQGQIQEWYILWASALGVA